MKNTLLIGLMLSLASFAAKAQENIPDQSKVPHTAMQRLAPMAGTWSMVLEYSPDEGATWQQSEPSEMETAYQLKNLILRERPTGSDASMFQTATTYSYDQYRNTYRIAVMDDTWGIMDIYEGAIEDGVLVATNLKSGTTFPINEDVSRAFRLKVKFLSATQRTLEIDKSDDGGKSWQPNFNLVYTKK